MDVFRRGVQHFVKYKPGRPNVVSTARKRRSEQDSGPGAQTKREDRLAFETLSVSFPSSILRDDVRKAFAKDMDLQC